MARHDKRRCRIFLYGNKFEGCRLKRKTIRKLIILINLSLRKRLIQTVLLLIFSCLRLWLVRNQNSFYTRMKGELEDAIHQLHFQQEVIMRPPSLIRKNTTKTNEKLAVAVLEVLNALGLFKKQRPMPQKWLQRL